MKIGCISWSYRNEFSDGKYDLFKWIHHCSKDVQLDGIEPWNNHFESLEDNYLTRISSLCKDEGLELYSVAMKCDFGDFSNESIQKAMNTMRDWLFATDKLGAKTMRISISGENERAPERRNIIIESITNVVNENRFPHITVGIENKEPSVIQNSEDVVWMFEKSKGKIKLILDNGSILDKSTVYDFMEMTLPYAALVHAKFFDISENGADNLLDYDRIIPIIKKSGYDGYLSIEYDSKEPASRDVPIISKYLRKRI